MITNKDLKACNEQVFSYSAAYQVPFYGREKTIEEMQELSNKLNPGEIIVISQPLGTGKTFLVNYMINNNKIDVPVGISFLTIRGIVEDPTVMERFPGDTLIVDEADIKTPIKKLIKGFELLSDYMKKSNRKAILLGDYSLKNHNISGALKNTIPLIGFENIDKTFLKGVLEQRFKHFLKLEDFELEEVMEPEIIDYLAPEWMRSVNNFRGIFSVLQQIVADDKYIRYNSDKAYFTLDIFKDFLCQDDYLQLDSNQKKFLKILREYITEMYPKGNGITCGFTVNELYELAGNGGVRIDLWDFKDEILAPFTMADLLISTGVPEYDNKVFERRPAPYVPSLRLLLSTL